MLQFVTEFPHFNTFAWCTVTKIMIKTILKQNLQLYYRVKEKIIRVLLTTD